MKYERGPYLWKVPKHEKYLLQVWVSWGLRETEEFLLMFKDLILKSNIFFFHHSLQDSHLDNI